MIYQTSPIFCYLVMYMFGCNFITCNLVEKCFDELDIRYVGL
jgi:hypothetical protein